MTNSAPLTPDCQALILDLYECGAIQFAPRRRRGYTFKFHQKHPRAPWAPMKLQLRTPEVKTYGGGSLTEAALGSIARELMVKITVELIHLLPRQEPTFAGIPFAGVPIIDAMSKEASRLGTELRVVRMVKSGEGNDRRISEIEPAPAPRSPLVLVDDVISHGFTKQEAFERAEEAGWLVVVLLVFADWQLGGVELLERSGIRVISACQTTQVVSTLVEAKLRPQTDISRLQSYIERDRAYRQKWAARW